MICHPIPPSPTFSCSSRANPKYRNIPQKSLIHYLAAIQAVAEFSAKDVEEAQISFLKAARVWKDELQADPAEDNWDAIS